MMLSAVSALLLSAAAATAQTPSAVLSDGTRLDVQQGSQVGSFMIRTDFGVLRSQGEQIDLIVDGSVEVRLLEPLRGLDYGQWALRLAERGHLQRLTAEPTDDGNRATLFDLLRPWGRRLDSLPPDTDRDERVALLWQRAMATDDPGLALLVGALEVEIAPSLSHYERSVSLVEWRKALHSEDPARRWLAARVAAVQRDANAELDLLDVGLFDTDLWVAMDCGRALFLTDPAGAAYRWAYEMTTSRDRELQRRCALQLAAWSRSDAQGTRHVATMLQAYSGRQGGRCPTVNGIPMTGSEITGNSVLEKRVPSTLMMLAIADVLGRVAQSATEKKPEPQELSAGATQVDREKAQAEAWRKRFMGR
jgi:hypothetical protein